MIKRNILLFAVTSIFAATIIFTDGAMAQGAATGGNVTYEEICIADPSAKLTPSVKPSKKVANVKRSNKSAARKAKLTKARATKPKVVEPLVTDICPPGQKPMRVAYVQPIAPAPQPVMSLCQSALGKSASVTSAQASSMLMAAGLSGSSDKGMLDLSSMETEELAEATAAAIRANPDAAPAILAYVMRGIPSDNLPALQAVAKAAYEAAPSQAAGLTYAAVSTNPGQTLPITQAMLGTASDADDSVIRQCAIDANPNLANEIATAAFVPALAEPLPAVSANDIRNSINNATGTTTLVPGMETREKDDSGV